MKNLNAVLNSVSISVNIRLKQRPVYHENPTNVKWNNFY